ncbi:MAG: response regulator [Bacteroidota bacterium]
MGASIHAEIKCILLVDDNQADNYLHQMVIEKMGIAQDIRTVHTGEEALEYLQQHDKTRYPEPNLIFLDINMPGINGWEFLEEYKKLNFEFHEHVLVVMLSTSPNPEDREKAQQNRYITDFLNKPLTSSRLESILSKHFS